MLIPSPTGVNPAYSIQIRVPARAVSEVRSVIADAPGTVTVQADEPGPAGAHRIILDADSARTLTWLTAALRRRLGTDLFHAEDLVFATASTGKLAQQVCAAVTTGHDVALLDADADRRVITHLAAHPRHTDRYTGRSRRIALLTDASAVLDFEPMPAETALPAVESQAVHLQRATGLDVIPLPVATRGADELATVIRMLAPGFAATVLVHTHIRHIETARAAVDNTRADAPPSCCWTRSTTGSPWPPPPRRSTRCARGPSTCVGPGSSSSTRHEAGTWLVSWSRPGSVTSPSTTRWSTASRRCMPLPTRRIWSST